MAVSDIKSVSSEDPDPTVPRATDCKSWSSTVNSMPTTLMKGRHGLVRWAFTPL